MNFQSYFRDMEGGVGRTQGLEMNFRKSENKVPRCLENDNEMKKTAGLSNHASEV